MKKNNKLNSSPIGVFDSGIGGLTVLKEITNLLPNEDTIYIGDTARVPYGIKSKETVTKYAFEISKVLIEKGVKVIVVACNSATAYALKELEEALPVPVIGVIEFSAKQAVLTSKTKHIAVIGTEATINSKAYIEAIHSIEKSITVESTACPLFVPLAEEGWTDNQVAQSVAMEYLKPYLNAETKIDTLVLGCTHYPLLKNVISNIMGSDVALIDSASATAKHVKSLLSEKDLLNNSTNSPSYSFFGTDSTERFQKIGKRFFGDKLSKVELLEI